MDSIAIFLQYMKSDRGYSECTLSSYQADLCKFKAFCASLDEELTWWNVDRDVVRQWVVYMMESGSSPRSIKRRLSALRSFYRYMLLTARCKVNPVEMVQGPKCSKPLLSVVKEQEIDRLFDVVTFDTNYYGQRDRYILLLFYSTGIRLGELVGLNMGDIDLEKSQLVVTGKRNKQRLIPFGDELREETKKYIALRCQRLSLVGDAMFLDREGGRINEPKVRSIVRRYLSKVTTMKKKSPHVLRHTFATVMLNHGAKIKAIKELLGHKSLSTTEIYTHTTFVELKKIYKQAHPWA